MADYLSAEDRERISQAVAAAEAQTSGEIVTVLTDRSDGYTDIALAWAVLIAFTALAALSIAPDFYLSLVDRLIGNWANDWTPREIFVLAAAVGTTKFLGMMLLQMWHPLKFVLIPGRVKSARTRARAVTCFRVGAQSRTHGRTGIVIYLSMDEHRAEIVADDAIVAKVPDAVWEHAMAGLLGHVRNDRVADGMIAAVERVGAVLAENFPRGDNDINEIPDRLIEV